ncbi:hypothetical protein RCS94_01150 [Orbaceae bacterium ac157xtp]
MIAPSSYGALSATSANTIKGNKPKLVGRTVAKKLGFKVGGTSYSEALGNIDSVTEEVFDKDLKLNEFIPKNLLLSDLTVGANYSDIDGDGAHTTAPFSLGSASRTWYESNGAQISDETKNLGCSGFRMPLTLKISVPVRVHSNYGAPKDGDADVLEQSYKITTQGICFAKPNSLHWVSYWGASGNSTNGAGYNQAQFDRYNGFKADLATKFPTTGFVGAEFTLVMVGNATDYTFTHNGGSSVTIDTDGKVTLNSKPSGAVTIEARYNNAPPTAQPDEYTFNPTTVWVVPKGKMNYASAKSACGVESNIPSRAELTNSPQKTATSSTLVRDNGYTRAVGGGVFGEWGKTNSTTYPGSWWDSSWHYYWTRDPYSSGRQFVVDSNTGTVSWSDTSSSPYVACLG